MVVERIIQTGRQENPWSDIGDKGKFLDFLDGYVKGLIETSGKDKVLGVMPHLIMSHGFMSWRQILVNNGELKFKRTQTREEQDKIERDEFNKFSNDLLSKPAFSALTPQERKKLKGDGWQAYLED